MKIEKSEAFFLAVISLIAVINRVYFLFLPIRYDEAFNFLVFGAKPLASALSDYSYPNNHLFHTLLLRFSAESFGWHAWALRIPAFLAGVLVVPAVYLCVKTFYGKLTAGLAAALVVSSSAFIEYSANARGYTFFTLFSVLTFHCLGLFALKQKTKYLVLFSFFTALGFYTMPVMLYPLAVGVSGFVYYALLEVKGRLRAEMLLKVFLSVLAAAALALALYSPVLIYSGLGSLTKNRFVVPRDFLSVVAGLPVFIKDTYSLWSRDVPIPAVFAALAAFVFSFFYDKQAGRKNYFIIISALAGCLIVLLLTRRIPFVRCTLFLLPLYFTVIASGVALLWENKSFKMPRPGLVFILIAIVLSANVLVSPSIAAAVNEEGAINARDFLVRISPSIRPGDKIVSFCPCDAVLIYYSVQLGIPYYYFAIDYNNADRVILITKHGQDKARLISRYGAPDFLNNCPAVYSFKDITASVCVKRRSDGL